MVSVVYVAVNSSMLFRNFKDSLINGYFIDLAAASRNSLIIACRYAWDAARNKTVPPAIRRLARILAACTFIDKDMSCFRSDDAFHMYITNHFFILEPLTLR